MLGFIDIDKFFFRASHILVNVLFSFPIIPIVNIGKKLGTLGKFSTYQKTIGIFLLELGVITPKILLSNLS